MAAGEGNGLFSAHKLNWKTVAGVALVSVLYFGDIFLKASRKCFWLDELFTTYLCRLPNFQSTWTAVLNGADFNPPLLYLFTRVSQSVFGENLIATRLPAMLGVWLFGVCLFLFVSRRAGQICGFIAGVFPFFTLAQYYAYEARAHGIVLGWCGLALVCWQRNAEGRTKYLWLAGFGLSLIGALLTHVYAVYLLAPFGAVELYNLLRARRIDWGVVGLIALAFASVTSVVYLPLFRVYRSANIPATFFPSSHDLFQRYLVAAVGPAISVLLLALILFAVGGVRRRQPTTSFAAIPVRELLLAAGFACLPVLGMIGCKISHGPFLDRYFLSSIAGYAIFLGFACSRWVGNSWLAHALAACMCLLMVEDLASTAYLAKVDRIMLTEPSSGLALSTTPRDPMRLYDTMAADRADLDILIAPAVEYLYFIRYAPPSVASHLYFGAPANNLFLIAYERLAKTVGINLKLTQFDLFLAAHDRFLVYESGGRQPKDDAFKAIAGSGYRLSSVRTDAAGIMYEFAK